MIRRFIIFGASGDLTARYLLPAFVQLHAGGELPDGLEITGVARESWDTAAFRRHIAARLEHHGPAHDRRSRQAVTAMLT